MSTSSFNPAEDVPNQSGRVFFVTGGTTGLGAGFISLVAAKNPARIFFSGRNATRANELITKIKASSPDVELTFIECDLTSLASVQEAARKFLSESQRLDVLMCNAGVMALPPGLSKDGYEIQFATNHLGHALLIKLLTPCLLETAARPDSDVRIVSLTSTAYSTPAKGGIEFETLKTEQTHLGPIYQPGKWVRYGQSKLANLLYAQELARHHPSVTTVAIQPGFVKTELHSQENFVDRQLLNFISGGKWIPVEEGPYNQTWAATTDKKNLENGAYYEPIGVKTKPSTALARDGRLAEKLWKWTEDELSSFS